jgi:hypothetical protein
VSRLAGRKAERCQNVEPIVTLLSFLSGLLTRDITETRAGIAVSRGVSFHPAAQAKDYTKLRVAAPGFIASFLAVPCIIFGMLLGRLHAEWWAPSRLFAPTASAFFSFVGLSFASIIFGAGVFLARNSMLMCRAVAVIVAISSLLLSVISVGILFAFDIKDPFSWNRWRVLGGVYGLAVFFVGLAWRRWADPKN